MANLLQYAKGIAETAHDGNTIKDTVITVPSHWNQRQRQAMIDAAKIAGLHCILVHETSAAAINLGMDWNKEKEENILYHFIVSRVDNNIDRVVAA